MQGRLSPRVRGKLQSFPTATWQLEFARAAAAGLQAIEWIFDGTDNPLLAIDGRDRIRALVSETGIAVQSICADYFMDAHLHRGTEREVSERLTVLRALIDRANEIGARHIVLPFVDQSAVVTGEDRHRLVEALGAVSAYAEGRGVELHLETSLSPRDFADLLDLVPDSTRANYDSGNSASLGFDVAEEFDAYGARVGSVHIKDRLRDGSTVPLGSGNVDFPAFFDALERTRYRGLITLQVARGEDGREIELARSNRDFVLMGLKGHAEGR
jgi:hexulose-6-phosphate isomerase